MPNDPYTDDEYDSSYEDVHGDEPAKDQYTSETTDDTFFPSTAGGTLSPSGWGIWPAGETADAETAYEQSERERSAGEDDDEGTWLDEGLIGTFLLVGVILFLFPEPATSAIGIGLVTIGVIAWIIDWLL